MVTIAFSNVKGGVGKTTSAVNLAAVLAADHGYHVLAVDLDPQSNLTLGLGVDPLTLEHTVYDVLHAPQAGPRSAIVRTDIDGLELLPASLDLAGAEVELSAKIGREERLRRALAALGDAYDFALIDTPPSLGLFTQNALMAARYVVSPVEPSFYALHALGQLRQMIDIIQPYNTALTVLGVVLTRYDARNRLTAEVESRLRADLGGLVFGTVIPVNVRAAEAPAAGQPVTRYAPSSPSAKAYRDLAAEVLARIDADA